MKVQRHEIMSGKFYLSPTHKTPHTHLNQHRELMDVRYGYHGYAQRETAARIFIRASRPRVPEPKPRLSGNKEREKNKRRGCCGIVRPSPDGRLDAGRLLAGP
ncbi:hypothetical protein TEQG_05944 [Trichophyton equinum CBS 127.97]|uniref:Uncharacterized protein n=1 Tax=Trichophyton equinum (strain ATCC MYA-4606 / CBS 127.97) TaxID=559882 RepID=F2PYC2_TRIEC|nr:hypothetical protein TEQG_05944 [Trichophyton equinum CBS 127.97]